MEEKSKLREKKQFEKSHHFDILFDNKLSLFCNQLHFKTFSLRIF